LPFKCNLQRYIAGMKEAAHEVGLYKWTLSLRAASLNPKP
jgi:hypothetical protein